jgi:hypothetical protein
MIPRSSQYSIYLHTTYNIPNAFLTMLAATIYSKGGSQLLRKAATASTSSSCSSSSSSRFMSATPLPPGDHKTAGAGAGLGNVRDRMIPSARSSRSTLYKHSAEPHTCTIIGAPMTYGQPYVGTDSGPSLLREAGLRGMLSSLGWRVEDLPVSWMRCYYSISWILYCTIGNIPSTRCLSSPFSPPIAFYCDPVLSTV